ncbi:hypothetical protein IEQ34_020296 [Dendrobium chrysotoxum]|uniref:Uncharacterized protein n=1 Tax=Dendrobium chrysotoxum TaxID=161865 RepID=A0AAV7G0I3_DENCH|nr:hypothetical protein IEQ34_020296 [Dendrobium chrysotoxum]
METFPFYCSHYKSLGHSKLECPLLHPLVPPISAEVISSIAEQSDMGIFLAPAGLVSDLPVSLPPMGPAVSNNGIVALANTVCHPVELVSNRIDLVNAKHMGQSLALVGFEAQGVEVSSVTPLPPPVLVDSNVVSVNASDVGVSNPELSPLARSIGDLVVSGAAVGVVSPNVPHAIVSGNDINCSVNLIDSPIAGVEFFGGMSASLADSGDKVLAVVEEAGVVMQLVDVPISVISNANLLPSVDRNSIRWQCD